MHRILFISAFIFFFSCNNPAAVKDNIQSSTVVKQDITGLPPSTVSGTFTGQLPCSNCAGIEVMLRLTDSTFWRFQNIKSAKDKQHSLQAEKGLCTQKLGKIILLSKNGFSESYKILSTDTILLISSSVSSSKKYSRIYFTRKK